jgi:hypothetical protein
MPPRKSRSTTPTTKQRKSSSNKKKSPASTGKKNSLLKNLFNSATSNSSSSGKKNSPIRSITNSITSTISKNITKTITKNSNNKGSTTDRPLQFLLVSLIIIPWLTIFFATRNEFHLRGGSQKIYPWNILRFQDFSFNIQMLHDLAPILTCLSLPHLLYVIVWTRPRIWVDFCDYWGLGEPFHAFAGSAHLLKMIQMTALLHWIYGPNFVSVNTIQRIIRDAFDLLQSDIPRTILILQLIGIGQLLNVAVYKAIGEAGVYYGTRLGIKVAWVNSFPFTVLADPQYLGATLTFWGLFLFWMDSITISRGIHVLMIAVGCFYVFSSMVERFL